MLAVMDTIQKMSFQSVQRLLPGIFEGVTTRRLHTNVKYSEKVCRPQLRWRGVLRSSIFFRMAFVFFLFDPFLLNKKIHGHSALF